MTFFRRPTQTELFLTGFLIITTFLTKLELDNRQKSIDNSISDISKLEIKLINGEDIVIKRQEGNDTVRYIVKPQTEKQILMFIPVDIKPETKL